eukprot:2478050-Rhodomonas_salina.1
MRSDVCRYYGSTAQGMRSTIDRCQYRTSHSMLGCQYRTSHSLRDVTLHASILASQYRTPHSRIGGSYLLFRFLRTCAQPTYVLLFPALPDALSVPRIARRRIATCGAPLAFAGRIIPDVSTGHRIGRA